MTCMGEICRPWALTNGFPQIRSTLKMDSRANLSHSQKERVVKFPKLNSHLQCMAQCQHLCSQQLAVLSHFIHYLKAHFTVNSVLGGETVNRIALLKTRHRSLPYCDLIN